jgi:hypothetical protein
MPLQKCLSTNGVGTTGHPHTKKMNLVTDLIPFIKMNPKWITDLNVHYKIHYKTPRR